MIDFLIILFNLALIALYVFIALIVLMFIQLISYKLFNFNIYKWLYKKLIIE